MQQQRHHRSIRHMPSDLIRDINVLQPRNPFNRSQPSDRVSRRRRSKQVPQHPIVSREPIDEPPSNDASNLEPGLLVGGDGSSEEIDVLNDSVGFRSSEFDEGVVDCSSSEGETDEGDGSNSDVTVDERVGENETCCFGSIESVGPRAGKRREGRDEVRRGYERRERDGDYSLVDEVTELGKN